MLAARTALAGTALTRPGQASSAGPQRASFIVEADADVRARRDRCRVRHISQRRKVAGTEERPRLAIFRSNENIYAQVIDDTKGHTMVAASSVSKAVKAAEVDGANVEGAAKVGTLVAELCAAKGITAVVFDRGGNLYHGRIKAVAEAARAAGLQF